MAKKDYIKVNNYQTPFKKYIKKDACPSCGAKMTGNACPSCGNYYGGEKNAK